MRSGELARITGVTVRALRHYHQVGILDEPPRTHNGYRRYGARDVVRVLRIKRMAALGIPLERMRPLLDDPGHDSSGLLDALDAELAAEIDRLVQRRRLIAELRADGASPDTPPELARFLTAFADSYPSPALAEFDRDQTILLAHLADGPAMAELTRLYERLVTPELLPVVTSLNARFAALEADASPEEVAAFADDCAAAMAPVIRTLADASLDLPGVPDLFESHSAEFLNPAQLQALELLSARFAAEVER